LVNTHNILGLLRVVRRATNFSECTSAVTSQLSVLVDLWVNFDLIVFGEFIIRVFAFVARMEAVLILHGRP
jgi:hypothetical protein